MKQVFGFRFPVVFTVGHEVIQTFFPRLNVYTGRPFDQDDDLQGDLEKEQVGLYPFGRMQVDRFQLVAAFRPAVGVLHLILILVGKHRIFYRQLRRGLIGDQRIIAGPTDGPVIGAFIFPWLSFVPHTNAWLPFEPGPTQPGVHVERYNLGQQPQAFVANTEVKSMLSNGGEKRLPFIFINDQLWLQGRYPAKDELLEALKIASNRTKPVYDKNARPKYENPSARRYS